MSRILLSTIALVAAVTFVGACLEAGQQSAPSINSVPAPPVETSTVGACAPNAMMQTTTTYSGGCGTTRVGLFGRTSNGGCTGTTVMTKVKHKHRHARRAACG